MTQQDIKNINYTTNDKSHIITSDTNKEIKKQIINISQQVLKRNYELYKALEHKWVHLIFNSPYKTSVNSIHS